VGTSQAKKEWEHYLAAWTGKEVLTRRYHWTSIGKPEAHRRKRDNNWRSSRVNKKCSYPGKIQRRSSTPDGPQERPTATSSSSWATDGEKPEIAHYNPQTPNKKPRQQTPSQEGGSTPLMSLRLRAAKGKRLHTESQLT